MAIKKFNESRSDAETKSNKLYDLVANPIKKKLRKEFNRAQREAIKEYQDNGFISQNVWIKHQDKLTDITRIGFKRALESGYLRLMKTFVSAEWITDEERKLWRDDIKPTFESFIEIQAKKTATQMTKTTEWNVSWLIKKYQEAEESAKNKKEFNAFADIIKKAVKEAKERSIWRSVVGALAVSHGGNNKGASEGAEQTTGRKQFNIFKFWVTRKDSKVRDTHVMMEGVSVLHNVAFDVPNQGGFTEQMMYPGDRRASIANWINCRCTLRYKRGEQ